MSISRLCVRISNCSRDVLSTWGERSTVHRLMMVGSSTGPATRAPVRRTVSTISFTDRSSSWWSYALRRMRIFWSAPTVTMCYSAISVTTPAPTVRPPSRIANRSSFSIAIGMISSIAIVTLSPGITISTPLGSVHTPVTSVVRK